MSAVDESAPPADDERDDERSELPIDSYEELTVARVLPQLAGLTRAQLWQVHDFECRHANRQAVLQAIERALG